MIKVILDLAKILRNMHSHETEWELNSFLNLICGQHILSESYGSIILVYMCLTYLSMIYVDVILTLYVTDIFECELCECYPELNMCMTYLSGSVTTFSYMDNILRMV